MCTLVSVCKAFNASDMAGDNLDARNGINYNYVTT